MFVHVGVYLSYPFSKAPPLTGQAQIGSHGMEYVVLGFLRVSGDFPNLL